MREDLMFFTDDCWMQKRGEDGVIIPFPDKFPSGMRALGDYIHSKGLKFGVYSDTGKHTCEGYPGSMGFEITVSISQGYHFSDIC